MYKGSDEELVNFEERIIKITILACGNQGSKWLWFGELMNNRQSERDMEHDDMCVMFCLF